MTGAERNLYNPNDSTNYGRVEASISGRLSAIIAMEEAAGGNVREHNVTTNPAKQDVLQAVGQTVLENGYEGMDHMGGA
jgi:hypothetical protein